MSCARISGLLSRGGWAVFRVPTVAASVAGGASGEQRSRAVVGDRLRGHLRFARRETALV